MTIYTIKQNVQNSPYFFTRKSMKFFNQTLKDFKVYKLENGNYYLTAPTFDNRGNQMGFTEREFNPITNIFV
jgi:hypothetical protein